MATAKKKPAGKRNTSTPIFRYPGKQELAKFLQANSKFFNLSEFERTCGFSSGTLRHISAGSREMQPDEYERLRVAILPKLCEFVLLLQHYD